jgi:hypothetical protein
MGGKGRILYLKTLKSNNLVFFKMFSIRCFWSLEGPKRGKSCIHINIGAFLGGTGV